MRATFDNAVLIMNELCFWTDQEKCSQENMQNKQRRYKLQSKNHNHHHQYFGAKIVEETQHQSPTLSY